ncbi:palmitoyltransferase pfa5 [Clarireedia jacksonii]
MAQDDFERNKRAANIWTARVIPWVLGAVVGYATYVLVALLCVNYLLVKHSNKSAAIPILVIYFVLFLLMASAFLRVVYMTTIDPPYAPLGAGAIDRSRKPQRKNDDIAGEEYTSGDSVATRHHPDSPGLELFYTKDVFTVERDGKPRWCSECCIWKLDRQHHCSVVGRCIYKMDHYCPWVGGPVGETNFKFFLQFVGYTALYCLHLLVVMAFYVHQQLVTKGESVNSQFIAILSLAAFFGLFTGTMASTSVRLAIYNLTQVEDINRHGKIHVLAILKPSLQRLAEISITAASTKTYPEITYPLSMPPYSGNAPNNMPAVKTIRHEHLSEPVPVDVARNMAGATAVRGNAASSISPAPARHSARDQQAVRTFAILETVHPGDNPWDLGSALLNWKSVMGDRVIDWFLPLKRSPCCNHENTESYFQVGPCVDQIRASVSFISSDELHARSKGSRRRRFSTDEKQREERKWRHFRRRDGDNTRKKDETEMRDLRKHNLHTQ